MGSRTQATFEINRTTRLFRRLRQHRDEVTPGADWSTRLSDVVQQEPLIETRRSLAALKHLPPGRSPGAVFVGVGLGTPTRLSEVVPLDILGVLLPAERIRRAVGAAHLVVLVADAHTHTNRFDRTLVDARALRVVRTLESIRGAAALDGMTIVRASDYHDSREYRKILNQVRRNGSGEDHPYFRLEVADVQYMNRWYDGVVKVGWTAGRSSRAEVRNDEVAFDRRFLRWVGRHIGFVYCKAGRVLDDRRPKASPYVTLNVDRRLCLQPDERVKRKFQRAGGHASEETVKGVKNHLKKIGRCYCTVVGPLQGTWEQRTQAMISRLSPA